MSDLFHLNPRTFYLPIQVRGGGGRSRRASPVSHLIASACRTFGTRTVLAEAVVVPLALAGLFIAGGML